MMLVGTNATPRFSAQLQRDHERCLQPDVLTPFRNMQDILNRLLPFHVWQMPERDLIHGMEAQVVPNVPQGNEAPLQFTVPYKKRRVSSPQVPDTPSSYLVLPPFPSEAYAVSVYDRYTNLQRRFRMLETRSSTTHERAPFMTASLEHIERLIHEDEMKSFQDLTTELRKARSELEEIERQRPWVMPVIKGTDASTSTSTSSPASHDARPSSPAARSDHTPDAHQDRLAASSRPFPIVRPPSHDNRPTPLPSTNPPPLSPPPVSNLAVLSANNGSPSPATSMPSRQSPLQAPGAATTALATAVPCGTATSMTPTPATPMPVSGSVAPTPAGTMNGMSSLNTTESLTKTSIPTQPLPLVVPIACVPRLTALGINLVPAPHLVPALSLASAGQSVAMNAGLTAPRPVIGAQNEPVLLVGITDAPASLPPAANQASRQRLHLSVVLSKLRPDQLSGLANIMQSLQADDENTSK